MNKCDSSQKTVLFRKDFSPTKADNKSKAQCHMSVMRFVKGDIDGGMKCIQKAILIFREINDYYVYCLENNMIKSISEFESAGRHTSLNEGSISILQRCISILDSSKECLPLVIDVLNGHDLFPNIDPEVPPATFAYLKALCRSYKCIYSLEKGDVDQGLKLMQEVIQLLHVSNVYHKHSYLPQPIIDICTSSNKNHIKTIETCLQIMNQSDRYLPLVINIFKGDKKLLEFFLK